MTLIKSPALRRADMSWRMQPGLVWMLSAMLSLDKDPLGFNTIKARMWTASLTFVEYFMGIASFNVNLIITAY